MSSQTLRDDYGVSKQPLMEALRKLKDDRIVKIHPQVGCQPCFYGGDEVREGRGPRGATED